MNSEKFKYDYLRYNKYHTLRPNLLLFLILIYLCKDIFFVFVIGAGSFKGGAGPGISNLADLVSPRMIVSNLPAIVVLVSLINRDPEAGRLMRLIWKNGRLMIILSIVIHTLLILSQKEFQFPLLVLSEWMLIGVDIFVGIYIFSSQLVKDIFAEFPT